MEPARRKNRQLLHRCPIGLSAPFAFADVYCPRGWEFPVRSEALNAPEPKTQDLVVVIMLRNSAQLRIHRADWSSIARDNALPALRRTFWGTRFRSIGTWGVATGGIPRFQALRCSAPDLFWTCWEALPLGLESVRLDLHVIPRIPGGEMLPCSPDFTKTREWRERGQTAGRKHRCHGQKANCYFLKSAGRSLGRRRRIQEIPCPGSPVFSAALLSALCFKSENKSKAWW